MSAKIEAQSSDTLNPLIHMWKQYQNGESLFPPNQRPSFKAVFST